LLFCGLVSFVSLCAGTSSSANVAALCGIITIGIARKSRIRTIMIFVLVVVLLLLLTGWLSWMKNASLQLFFPGKSWDVVATGHGRVHLWQQCWPEIAKRPLLGSGFAAPARLKLGTVSAHNTFMDILLSTGIIGLVLFGLRSARLPVGRARLRRRGNRIPIGAPDRPVVRGRRSCPGAPRSGPAGRPSHRRHRSKGIVGSSPR